MTGSRSSHLFLNTTKARGAASTQQLSITWIFPNRQMSSRLLTENKGDLAIGNLYEQREGIYPVLHFSPTIVSFFLGAHWQLQAVFKLLALIFARQQFKNNTSVHCWRGLSLSFRCHWLIKFYSSSRRPGLVSCFCDARVKAEIFASRHVWFRWLIQEEEMSHT